jgi:phage terminase large subunit-like protein
MTKKRISPSEYARLSTHERLAFCGELARRRWRKMRRKEQIPGVGFEDTWVTHLTMAGRGFGKTRTGAEWALDECTAMPGCMFGILCPTYDHGEKVCLYGESGVMALLADHSTAKWNSYKHQLTFANGSIITLYSSEHQRQLAGPQFHRFWIDEPADLSHGLEAWKKLRPAVRLRPSDGTPARVLITGTPAPVPLVQHIWDLHNQHPTLYTLSKGRTIDNEANLDPMMVQELYERYKGSRYFLQEMEGELLLQAEGALWHGETIARQRIAYDADMHFDEIIVAIDPAVSTDKNADETGIIVAGKAGNLAYVLADYSCRASALDWARLAYKVAEFHGARKIVYERNLAGPLLEDILRKVLQENHSKIKLVRVQAKKSKSLRAEPVAALYEAERVFHLTGTPSDRGKAWGSLDKLESQMTTWEPSDSKSPDRIDALVHAIDHLLVKGAGGAKVYGSKDSRRGRNGATYRGW